MSASASSPFTASSAVHLLTTSLDGRSTLPRSFPAATMKRQQSSRNLNKLVPEMAESVLLPPQRDLSFYLVLFLAVIPLWSIPPLSWAFVIYALRSGKIWSFTWPGCILFTVALFEVSFKKNNQVNSIHSVLSLKVFFSVYHYNLSSYIHNFSPNTSSSITELQTAFRRVLKAGLSNYVKYDDPYRNERAGSPAEVITPLSYDDPRAIDFRHRLRTWYRFLFSPPPHPHRIVHLTCDFPFLYTFRFGKAPWSSIHKHEVYSWLYWSIFSAHFTSLDALPEAQQVILKEAVQLLEYRSGTTIPEGSNPAAKPLRLTLDPVRTIWRPFAWYVAVGVSNYWLRTKFMRKWNVTFGCFEGLECVFSVLPSFRTLFHSLNSISRSIFLILSMVFVYVGTCFACLLPGTRARAHGPSSSCTASD